MMAVLAFLGVIFIQYLLVRLIMSMLNESDLGFRNPFNQPSPDVWKPQESSDEIDLNAFEPNFEKPLTVNFEEPVKVGGDGLVDEPDVDERING